MKKKISAILIFIIIISAFYSCYSEKENNSSISSEHESSISKSSSEINSTASENSTEEENLKLNYKYMKAMWLSQYDMAYVFTKNGEQREKSDFTKLLGNILDNVKSNGYNTVIMQVRPFADSFCKSELFPPSRFISGSYLVKPKYDVFEIAVTECHKRGLSIHAWVNPMRAMTDAEIKNVSNEYTIKKWYNDFKKRGSYISAVEESVGKRWYFNPAEPEVRKLIVNGVEEICRFYDVDGVHMDDYFYPTEEKSFDMAAYAEYQGSGGKMTLFEFRCDSVNKLVKEIYSAVKAVNKNILFGISPAGIVTNAYNKICADIYTWGSSEGYVDYLCPQIYFGLEHENYDFIKVYNEWKSIVNNDSVQLCIGVSLIKAKSGVDIYAGSGKYEWAAKKDVLKRCLEYISTDKQCSGVFMFSYQHYYDPLTNISDSDTETERRNMEQVFLSLGK